MYKFKKIKLKCLSFLCNIYAKIICPQQCVLCRRNTASSHPLCEGCYKQYILDPFYFNIKNTDSFCKKCGRFLISKKIYCTSCKQKQLDDAENCVDRIFVIYFYKTLCGQILRAWKSQDIRSIADIYAKIISLYIAEKKELHNIPIVPVPPRPKKMKTRGWDQIEDLAVQLECFYNIKIIRCLKRKDGVSQKTLSREKRAHNLKGKISCKSKNTIPETLIILDDIMTTGATLQFCAKALKENGCKKIYGLCLFFD